MDRQTSKVTPIKKLILIKKKFTELCYEDTSEEVPVISGLIELMTVIENRNLSDVGLTEW